MKSQKIRYISGGIAFLLFGMMAFGQSPSTNGGSAPPSGQSAGSPGASGSSSQNPFFGSVPTGEPTAGALPLSFQGAIDRGLKYNLGLLLTGEGVRAGRGQRWKELSNLLPHVTTDTSANVKQVDLATFGIKLPSFPAVVGPFGYFDTRAYLTQHVFDWKAVNNVRSANENLRASEYSYKDARELVVLAVGYAYLQGIAGEVRVETAEAQRKTAQALYNQAADQQKAGVSPAIDTLRANVELQSRQQMVIAARNDFAKLKLTLARAIGLPLGQELELTDRAPYRPSAPLTVDEALTRAYARRSDYQSALAQVRASEYARRAAGYLPSLEFDGDYGVVGVTLAHSHGTFDAAGTLRIPLFQGGKVHGEVLQAEATLNNSRSQLENLRGQIDQDVRTALLDLQATAEQVAVAASNVELAGETLAQARDRFAAGVTDNIEVVQAQEAVASANESYISSLYTYNFARISLARATGLAEEGVKRYLEGKE